jgi:hypothetical protein
VAFLLQKPLDPNQTQQIAPRTSVAQPRQHQPGSGGFLVCTIDSPEYSTTPMVEDFQLL